MFNGKRLSGWMALAVFATVGGAMVATDPAFAKTDVDKLTIGGEIRERYEVRTNATFNAGQSNFGTGPGGTRNVLANKGNESIGSHRVRVNVGYDLTPDVADLSPQLTLSRVLAGVHFLDRLDLVVGEAELLLQAAEAAVLALGGDRRRAGREARGEPGQHREHGQYTSHDGSSSLRQTPAWRPVF